MQKIDEIEDQSTYKVRSSWNSFTRWCKKPFYLDSSITKDETDYFTSVYSSNVDKFRELFDTLHGSREAYFTPGERSLLTYELLNRVHFHMQDSDHYGPAVKKLGKNRIVMS